MAEWPGPVSGMVPNGGIFPIFAIYTKGSRIFGRIL